MLPDVVVVRDVVGKQILGIGDGFIWEAWVPLMWLRIGILLHGPDSRVGDGCLVYPDPPNLSIGWVYRDYPSPSFLCPFPRSFNLPNHTDSKLM